MQQERVEEVRQVLQDLQAVLRVRQAQDRLVRRVLGGRLVLPDGQAPLDRLDRAERRVRQVLKELQDQQA